jgi:hypothetical protein
MRNGKLKTVRLRVALLVAVLVGLFLLLSLDMRPRLGDLGLLPSTNATGYIHRLLGAQDTVDQAAIRAWEIARATQHTGTGARVHRFLEKAKRGEPFTVAAIGGSGMSTPGLADGSVQGPGTRQPQRRGPCPPTTRCGDGCVYTLLAREPSCPRVRVA